MRITAIESRVYRYPLDPPFVAAWDPIPRTEQLATLVLAVIRGLLKDLDATGDSERADRAFADFVAMIESVGSD